MSWTLFTANILVKGFVVLGVATLMTLALRRASAASRHAVWAVALLSLLALPFLSSALPSWRMPVPVLDDEPAFYAPPEIQEATRKPKPAARPEPAAGPQAGATLSFETPTPSPRESRPPSAPPEPKRIQSSMTWQTWILTIWLAGFALFTSRILVGLVRSRFAVRSAEEIKDPQWKLLCEEIADQFGIAQRVRLLESPRASLPMTCGFFRSSVLLPENANTWTVERRRSVLLHEMAHVKRRDCLVQFLAQLTCAAHWCNPAAWFAARELRRESERACDDLVLHAGTRPSDYAHDLLDMARALTTTPTPTLAAVTLAHRSRLEERLLAILNPKLPRKALSRLSVSLAALAVVFFVFPLATIVPSATAREASSPLAPNPLILLEGSALTNPVLERIPSQVLEPASVIQMPSEVETKEQDVDRDAQMEVQVDDDGDDDDDDERQWVEERLLIPLIEALADPEPAVREQAASVLGDLEDERAVEPLMAAASDENEDVRAQVIWALGSMEDPRAFETFRSALSDESEEVQENALWALGQLEDPRSVDALTEALQSSNPDIRETAASSLGQIEDPRAIDALTSVIDDESPDVREQAVWALGMIEDPGAVPTLKQALKDENPDVRGQAAWALGKIEDPGALDALAVAVNDESADVREQVVWAMGMIQDPASVDALSSALNDLEPGIREQAAWALGMIQDPRAVDPLIAAVADSDSDVRSEVVWALGMIQDRKSLDALTLAIKDESPDVRAQALWAISMLARPDED